MALLSNILGGKVVRRVKKKARVSRVAMPTSGVVGGSKVVVSEVVKFAGKAIRCVGAGGGWWGWWWVVGGGGRWGWLVVGVGGERCRRTN